MTGRTVCGTRIDMCIVVISAVDLISFHTGGRLALSEIEQATARTRCSVVSRFILRRDTCCRFDHQPGR